ncbi:MAG: hypothetical protein AAF741_04880 [Bacteroidota bacterium]
MRFLLTHIALLLIGLLQAASPADSLLVLAHSAEEAENWATAASHYQSVYDLGYRSTDLFINQGNAYLADEQLGRAILAYERGLRFQPGSKRLKNNLAIAEADMSLQLTRFPEFFLWRWADWLSSRMGSRGTQWLGMLCWWLAIGLGAWWVFRRNSMTERRRFWIPPAAVFSLLLFGLFLWLGNWRQSRMLQDDMAIIVVEQVDMVAAPEADATYEMTAYEGLRARIVDAFAGYRKIELDNGRRGWVPATSLEVI